MELTTTGLISNIQDITLKKLKAQTRLQELEDFGFIQSFIPHGHKTKGKFYKVIDEYILFYLHWIEPTLVHASRSKKIWHNRVQSANWKAWSGLAFEAICYKHIDQIACKLEIDAGALAYPWSYKPEKGSTGVGAQIDLLFDRDDNAISLCEIKYTDKPFVIDKQYAKMLLNKKLVFEKRTKTNKQIFIVMIKSICERLRSIVFSFCKSFISQTLIDICIWP